MYTINAAGNNIKIKSTLNSVAKKINYILIKYKLIHLNIVLHKLTIQYPTYEKVYLP